MLPRVLQSYRPRILSMHGRLLFLLLPASEKEKAPATYVARSLVEVKENLGLTRRGSRRKCGDDVSQSRIDVFVVQVRVQDRASPRDSTHSINTCDAQQIPAIPHVGVIRRNADLTMAVSVKRSDRGAQRFEMLGLDLHGRHHTDGQR
uniref:Uncharacterized protein n=1 Tax=Burkholderia sp. M701 TaxID=326454 RepID=V5YPF7_9BURK|nr:hypothetical protein [Burkholderia sp. M701]